MFWTGGNRGLRRRSRWAVSAIAVAGGFVGVGWAGAAWGATQPQRGEAPPVLITSYTATVQVNQDGSLHVAESATYDVKSASQLDSVQRVITTREHYDAQDDRVYGVTNIKVGGRQIDATASVASDDSSETIDVRFASPPNAGQSFTLTFDYTVTGAVAQTADGLEVRWPVVQGFDTSITKATVRWEAPGVTWLSCLAGAPGSSRPCTTAQLAEVAGPTMNQAGLAAGDEMVGILGLSGASGVAANADLRARWSLARGFTATGTPLLVALCLLATGLLAALALWWVRGRDSQPDEVTFRSPVLDGPDGRAVFAPPSGVRPGQMGTLVDERADLVDVTATIVDLAVRNYVFIEELPRSGYLRRDWLLHRRNEPGDELLTYEREVFEAMFADAREVRVSELDPQLRLRLPGIQALMYDDMVDQRWFGERPDSVRGRWSTAGWVLMAAGAVLAVVLALVSTFGLVGLAVLLSGAALAASGQLAPARTARGGRVLSELRDFRAYLETADVSDIPAAQREELLSRFLPYALVFGLGERWAAALAALDDDEDPDEPLYWYGAPSDWHLSDAAPSLMELATTLSAALATRRLLGV